MTVGDSVTALTNTPISIDCPASGIPTPILTWTKDDQELSPGSGYVIYENGTLVIEKGIAEDEGRYKCTLTNINGKVSETSSAKFVGM